MEIVIEPADQELLHRVLERHLLDVQAARAESCTSRRLLEAEQARLERLLALLGER